MKDIIKIFLLSLILIVISSIIIIIFGRTYTTSFNLKNTDKYEMKLENDSGVVEILDEKEEGNKYIVKIKAKKSGKAFLEMNYGDTYEYKAFYVHKSMVITNNNYFGKSTGSEVIPISIFIILLYMLYLLIKKYNYYKKENLYQYKNIAYLGIIVFLSFFALNIFKSIFNYQGIYETINSIINSGTTVSIYLLPIAFITFILVTISNIKLIIKEGRTLKNLLGLFLGIFICVSTFLPDLTYNYLMKRQIINIYNLNGPGPYIYNFIETLIYFSVAYLECVLFGTIIITIKAVKKKPKYNKDYVIILGCKVSDDCSLTPLLKGRVDKALEFRNKQIEKTGKDLVFIPSGGKGDDEVISEAEAIKKYLLEKGVEEKNIIVENKSRNTFENIKFSYRLINNKKANICFSTTNYHVLRAGLIATEQNIKLEGIGSNTKAYFWINAFIREFIGTLYSEKKKHIIVFGLIAITIIFMITLTYIANNI